MMILLKTYNLKFKISILFLKLIHVHHLLILVLAVVIGCSKDKRVANKLDGVWSIDTKTYVDQDTTYTEAGTFTFQDCSQDSCTGTLLNENEIEVPFDWYVTSMGSTITIRSNDINGFLVKGIYTIESIKKKKMEMSYDQLGKRIRFELTKSGG